MNRKRKRREKKKKKKKLLGFLFLKEEKLGKGKCKKK